MLVVPEGERCRNDVFGWQLLGVGADGWHRGAITQDLRVF